MEKTRCDTTRRQTLSRGLRCSMVSLSDSGSDKSYEFFYQLGLSEFGNFGTIEIPKGLDLRELLAISMDADRTQKNEIEVCHPCDT